MQQRQLRLGDILDDYCPRERRLTNHAVVAMVGDTVKQTRCTTCDADHEYKHAKVPRQRRKPDTPAALYSQVLAGGPKRVAHDGETPSDADMHDESLSEHELDEQPLSDTPEHVDDPLEQAVTAALEEDAERGTSDDDEDGGAPVEEGPVHRPLIRATLPRPEGQPPPTRPAPEFTIRQPGGRPNRFRQRQQHGPFQGNRSNGNMGNGPMRGGAARSGGGRPPQGAAGSRLGRRHGHKRSK